MFLDAWMPEVWPWLDRDDIGVMTPLLYWAMRTSSSMKKSKELEYIGFLTIARNLVELRDSHRVTGVPRGEFNPPYNITRLIYAYDGDHDIWNQLGHRLGYRFWTEDGEWNGR